MPDSADRLHATQEQMCMPTDQLVDTREPGVDSCVNQTNAAVDALAAGASFVLIADHDPIGLCYMLDAERPGQLRWQALQRGPVTWQVRFTRVTAARG